MTVAEILEELPALKPEERLLVWERLNELESEIEETPELLAAIDEAEKSIEEGGGIPIEEVRARLEAKWRTP